MIALTLEQLCAATGAAPLVAKAWLAPLTAAMERFGITTPKRIAAFLAQCGHESIGLTAVSENLNYTPQAILATFNTRVIRFTKEQAELYGRTAAHKANQQMIANIAYANRGGNGSVESGDGFAYRGRGPGQLTFKNNYRNCGDALGLDLVGHPAWVERPDVGSLAFAWYWSAGNPTGRDLSVLADAGNIDAISDAVNLGRITAAYGDSLGFANRRDLTNKGLQALA